MKYNLKILTGSPGDFEENIDWEKYKNVEPKYVDFEIEVEHSPLLDSNTTQSKSPIESYELLVLDLSKNKEYEM
jgi:hypothetical protein